METRDIAERNKFSYPCESHKRECMSVWHTFPRVFFFCFFFCPVAICVSLGSDQPSEPDKVRDKGTHSPSPLSVILCLVWFLLHIRRGLVLPRTLSAVWHTHACAIHTAQGLITWHTYMTSSACNQIHMSPSLFPLSWSISVPRWDSFTLFIHPWLRLHIPLSVCLSLVLSCLFPLSFTVFVHHLCFFSCLSLVSDLSLGLSMGFAVKMERDFDCLAKNPHVDLCCPFMAKIRFYGHSLAEDLLFVVVMMCCTVQIVVIVSCKLLRVGLDSSSLCSRSLTWMLSFSLFNSLHDFSYFSCCLCSLSNFVLTYFSPCTPCLCLAQSVCTSKYVCVCLSNEKWGWGMTLTFHPLFLPAVTLWGGL